MRPFPSQIDSLRSRRLLRLGAVFAGALLLWSSGCQKRARTDDPLLKPIQEMLDARVPPGTPEEKVLAYLTSRGYAVLPSQKPGTIVARIPIGDIEQVPVTTAQITFYFDANGKLNTFELQRAPDARPAQ